jgi:hypothetical protein
LDTLNTRGKKKKEKNFFFSSTFGAHKRERDNTLVLVEEETVLWSVPFARCFAYRCCSSSSGVDCEEATLRNTFLLVSHSSSHLAVEKRETYLRGINDT